MYLTFVCIEFLEICHKDAFYARFVIWERTKLGRSKEDESVMSDILVSIASPRSRSGKYFMNLFVSDFQ